MRHHQHPAAACTLDPATGSVRAHPDSEHPEASVAWFPVAGEGDSIEAVEGLLCVPTRPGAARVAAVPHVVRGVTLGDEVAIADVDGDPYARGLVATALRGTIHVVLPAPERDDAARDERWVEVLAELAPLDGWMDALTERVLAISVPRAALPEAAELLRRRAARRELEWEYVTPERHA